MPSPLKIEVAERSARLGQGNNEQSDAFGSPLLQSGLRPWSLLESPLPGLTLVPKFSPVVPDLCFVAASRLGGFESSTILVQQQVNEASNPAIERLPRSYRSCAT